MKVVNHLSVQVSRDEARKLCNRNSCDFSKVKEESLLLNSGAVLFFDEMARRYLIIGHGHGKDTFEALYTIAVH